VRDHVGVMDGLERFPVARVEEIVTLCHERQQVLSPARISGCGCHKGLLPLVAFDLYGLWYRR